MKTQELRLPKLVEKDPRSEKILSILINSQKKLWENSKVSVSFLPFSGKFIQSLQMEHRKGRIVRGLESIERNLSAEAKGLTLVDEKTDSHRGQRVSRLLIISNDGAERFYRKVENLLLLHSDRVLAILIAADSLKLGQLFFGEGKAAKLVLLEHKESVASALFSLAEAFENKGTL